MDEPSTPVKVLNTLDDWRSFCEQQRRTGHEIGLVPTMGALHEGHETLIRTAVNAGDVVVVTSFVNPLQFSNAVDLATYPATPQDDERLARRAGASVLVRPSVDEMWPDFPTSTLTTVSVAGLGDILEGRDRPGHFDGVATVVAKLFAITGPCHAYFGEKDFQQVAVVARMVRDMAWPVTLRLVATVRDADGLALSSRNRRLSPQGRACALGLHHALVAAAGSSASVEVRKTMMGDVMRAAGVAVAYAEIVDPVTLDPVDATFTGEARALVAGLVEGVRLIDNAPLTLGGTNAAGY